MNKQKTFEELAMGPDVVEATQAVWKQYRESQPSREVIVIMIIDNDNIIIIIIIIIIVIISSSSLRVLLLS